MRKAYSMALFTVAYLLLPCSGTSKVFENLLASSIDLGLASLRGVDNRRSAVISSHSIFDGLYMLQKIAKNKTLEQLTSKIFNTYDVKVVGNHQKEQRQKISQISNITLNYQDIITMKRLNNLVVIANGLENRKIVQYAKEGENSAKLLRELNDNVSRLSNGIINHPFEATPQEAPLILTNVMYFRGEWEYKFNKSLTERNQPFEVESDKCKPNRKNVTVSMMKIEKPFAFEAFPEINAQGIRVPFVGDDVSMYIFLPSKGMSVDQIMKALNGSVLMNIIRQLKENEYEDDDVLLELPIFDATTSVSLKSTLQRLGVKNMFDLNAAEFRAENLFVSDVKHKAFFKINEEGAEAAAQTQDTLVNKANAASFKANRPFIYVVANTHTAEVYFMGRYMGPKC